MFSKKLSEYKGAFSSDKISDADQVEKKAVEFRNWFVQDATKDNVIQNYEKCKEYSILLVKHYRPKCQECGCDCLLIIFKEAAPIQLKTNEKEFREVIDKLVVIGHDEVASSLIPLIHTALPYIFSTGCTQEFHDFFLHLLDFWDRNDTKPESRFLISSEIIELINFAGLASSRYISSIFTTVSSKLKFERHISHIIRYLEIIESLLQNTAIISKLNQPQYFDFIQLAKEQSNNDQKVILKCNKIIEIVKSSPEVPVLQ